MKFYGNGTVWDKSKDKALCKFEKGILETTDKYISDKLIELKYRCESTIDYEITDAEEEIIDEEVEEVVRTTFCSYGC